MKILSLGLDNSVLNKNSALAKRTVEYGNLVDQYCDIVPNKTNCETELSQKVQACGVESENKVLGLINIFKLAKKLIKREKFDIITVQDQYYLGLIGLLLARRLKIGLEIQVHGFEKFNGLRKLIAKFVLPRAGAVRVVSERLKKFLVEEFKVKEERITVVPIYSGIRNQESGIRNYELKEKFIFLTVGRLVAVKNIGMQIKVLANIVKQYTDVELWIIGEGPGKRKLQITNYKLQISGNVKFLGWQNDLSKYYEQADAFLLTSNSEGWGLAVIEAASCGLPIIMTDVGCAGEVIVDGESGLVIPAGDQSKLEESMVKLINDAALRKKLGEGARKAIENLPTQAATFELYKKSWESASADKKR